MPCTVRTLDNKQLQQLSIGMPEGIDTTILHNSNSTSDSQSERKKKSLIANLYRYSDLSLEAIAQQVKMNSNEVQVIVDGLVKDDALEALIDQSMTRVEKIMTPIVMAVDCSNTVHEAAALMGEKGIGSVIVTKDSKPFGIITHSDIVKWVGRGAMLLNAKLEDIASRPLISLGRGATVEEAAKTMMENQIHKLPLIDDKGKLLGIVTITDLAVFLSPSRRAGMALSLLRAISRGKIQQQ